MYGRAYSFIKGKKGFSMGEVVVAMALFLAAVLGITTMMVSGSGNVTRGSLDNKAANLAASKIEEVKTLPFYRTWSGTTGDQDIDDYYWAYSSDSTPVPLLNSEQYSHPKVEDSIPGYAGYTRTTAVQYMTKSSGSLQPAVMELAPNQWVPKNPTAGQTDEPLDNSSPNPVELHGIQIEVRVFYQSDTGRPLQYVEHGMAGDLMVTGGTANPVMSVSRIDPPTGMYMTTNSMSMNIYLTATGATGSSKFKVNLWYAGLNDFNMNETWATVHTSGGKVDYITCHFNLQNTDTTRCRPGYYNLAVNWADEGWTDKSLHKCFNLLADPPQIDSISNYNWGYKKQTGRQIVITGQKFYGTINAVRLIGPDPSNGTSIDASSFTKDSTTQITARFNLTNAINPASNWNVVVVNAAGSDASNDADERLLMNPNPTITGITATSGTSYFNWAHSGQTARKVRIEGTYLYGLNETDTVKKLFYGGTWSSPTYVTSSNATWVSGGTGDTCNYNDPVVLAFNPSSAFADSAARYTASNTRWTIHILNYGSSAAESTEDADRVLMNPPPTITAVTATSSPNYYNWAYRAQADRKVRIEGTNLYGLGDAGRKARLRYTGHGTHETSTDASPVSPPDPNDWQTNDTVVLTFHPNTAGCDSNENNKYFDARLTNYGGTIDSTSDSRRVLMNPPPTITAKGGFPSPANTGTAANPSKTYSSLSLTGSYLQDGATESYLVNGVQTPGAGSVYMNLGQGVTPTTGADGGSVNGLNMRMHVNPLDMSFMLWGGGTPGNPAIAGTYYVYFKNPDGQACTTSLTQVVSHAQYSYTVSAKQPLWATVAGGGTRYQDENVTISATASEGNNAFLAWDEWNGSTWTQISTQNPWNIGVASANKTYRCRYRKWLFNSGSSVAWVRQINDSPNDYHISSDIYCNAWYSLFGGGNGEVSVRTSGTVNFANAEYLRVNWQQTNIWGNSYFGYATNSNGNRDSWTGGNRIFEESSYGYRTQSLAVSSYQGSYYVRIHATNDSVWDSKVYVNQVYLE